MSITKRERYGAAPHAAQHAPELEMILEILRRMSQWAAWRDAAARWQDLLQYVGTEQDGHERVNRFLSSFPPHFVYQQQGGAHGASGGRVAVAVCETTGRGYSGPCVWWVGREGREEAPAEDDLADLPDRTREPVAWDGAGPGGGVGERGGCVVSAAWDEGWPECVPG